MPEGDTVHQSARRIHDALAGRTPTRAELRVPRFAALDLRGRTVVRARARGKHLLVEVGPDADGRDPITLHLHLKMEGRIHAHPAGTRWRFPAHSARLVLAADGVEVVGTEPGFLRALSPEEAARAVAHLGPDVLGEAGSDAAWDPAEAARRIRDRPRRTIGEALLDQRNLAGLGTIYRAESCFLRGLDPRQAVEDVPDVTALVELARRLVVANRDRTVRVTTGDPRRGRELWIYGRGGRPCRRCGSPVEEFRLGGGEAQADPLEPADSLDRVAFACPTCQPRRGRLGTPRTDQEAPQ